MPTLRPSSPHISSARRNRRRLRLRRRFIRLRHERSRSCPSLRFRARRQLGHIFLYIYIYVDVQGEGTPATIRNLQNLVTTHSAEWRYRQFEMKRNIRGVLYSTSKQGGFARLSSTGDTGLKQLHLRKISHKSARTLPANHEITTRLRSHCVAAFAGCNDDTYKP